MKNETVKPKKYFSSVVETEINANPSMLFVSSGILFTAFDFPNIYEFVFQVLYSSEHVKYWCRLMQYISYVHINTVSV